jgi:hypothetical protein
MGDYSLYLSTSTLSGSAPLADLTERAQMWRRSIRTEGPFLGSFRLTGSPRELTEIFGLALGYHLEEWVSGVKNTEWMIYEMDAQINGLARRRSLDEMYNAVKITYIDDSDTVQTSSFSTQAQSIAAFGRREQLLTLDGYKQATAEQWRDSYLAENAWPVAKVIGSSQQRDYLDVRVAGYAFTGNWRLVTVQDGASDDVDDYISAIIGTDCEFLTAGKMQTNTLSVVRQTNTPMRSWDAMRELVKLGDSSSNRYRLHVIPGRIVVYEQIDTTPIYRWTEKGLRDSSGGEVNPWTARPGVARDAGWVATGIETGSWLSDRRDFYVEEIEVGARSGLSFRAEGMPETELIAAHAEYRRWVSSLEDEAPAGKRNRGDRESKWRWGDMSPEQRAWWEGGREGPPPD